MIARCTAGDIQKGDTVRVSLPNRTPPYSASMINIYREDTGEAVSEEDPEGESDSATAKRRRKRPQARTPRGSSTERQNSSKARRYFRIGLKLLKKGKRDAAIEYLDRAREADPSDELAERIADVLDDGASRDVADPD